MDTHRWLLPLSWLYGLGVGTRNLLYDCGVLASHRFDIPVITVGNIAVGGTGKTPHTEHLIRLLSQQWHVAVLSRGYKRKSHGYLLANDSTTALDIGDEPFQMKRKFANIDVAVDADRCHGIQQLNATVKPQVVLLDDAFQHRRLTPGLSILLLEHNRLGGDWLLPAGRLREPMRAMRRANIIVVTKCPPKMSSDDMEAIRQSLSLLPQQRLHFSTIDYEEPVSDSNGNTRAPLSHDTNVLLVTGIAHPKPLYDWLAGKARQVVHSAYGDHHHFTDDDISNINSTFEALPPPAIVMTTEKDAARLASVQGLSRKVRDNLYRLPIRVRFLDGDDFDHDVLQFVNTFQTTPKHT